MKIFLPTHKWLLAVILQVSLVTFTSCEEESAPQHNDDRISWNVISTNMQYSRAMIEGVTDLKDACTYGNGKSIGIKSSYILDGSNYDHVLGNPDGDVSLIYNPNTSHDNYEGWAYNETSAYWQRGAKYTFNAYYPMEQVLQMSEITSNANSPFVMSCNTELFQEDLLMAYKYVNTSDYTFNSKKPVDLNMLHALSALKFIFTFTHNDQDRLTDFWLENTTSYKGLSYIGELEFGDYNEDGTINNGEKITWTCKNPSAPSNKMYQWEDANGVTFSQNTYGVAYSTKANEYQKYTENNAFILIIPQVNDGTTNFCFKLKSTGDHVYSAKLPTPPNASHAYEAGKRYIYEIKISSTSIDANITIANWDEYKSSVDITLP